MQSHPCRRHKGQESEPPGQGWEQPRVAATGGRGPDPGSGVTSPSRCAGGSTAHVTLPKPTPNPQPEQLEGAGGTALRGGPWCRSSTRAPRRERMGKGNKDSMATCCCPQRQQIARTVNNGLCLSHALCLTKHSLITKCAETDCGEGWR